MKKQQQPRREYLFDVSLALMVICLSAAYLQAGRWPGTICAAGLGVLWCLTRSREPYWFSHIYLLLSLTLAAAAILTHVQPVLAILASGLSLVTWDLHLLMHDLRESELKESTRRYEQHHLQSLALAVIAGLLVALIGRLIPLNLPFIVLVILILLSLFALDRFWRILNRSR
jgi:hypothetical protein